MMEMYRSGLTLQAIGDRYQITRERVRQILRKCKVSVDEGGQTLRAAAKRAQRAAARDQRYLAKYGFTYGEYVAIGARARKAYNEQKCSARNRGLEFGLTMRQWWDIWQQSGHWNERGRGSGYCMSRVGDRGGYTFGNVYITTCRENVQEFRQRKPVLGRSETPGVHLRYPTLPKPFVVMHGRKVLGYFATREEAWAVKQAYVAAKVAA